jgi:hypothetical protein
MTNESEDIEYVAEAEGLISDAIDTLAPLSQARRQMR